MKKQYYDMVVSSSKKIIESGFPEDESWASSQESDKEDTRSSKFTGSQPLPAELEDESMSGILITYEILVVINIF